MLIEAVKVRRLYLEVADQLSALIKEGTIKPGERLPSERDLASRFGVSRPTIREAMIALEIEGVVEIRTGSGIYVTQNQKEATLHIHDTGPGPFEILESRRIIESETASLAAARINDEQLQELEDALAEMAVENQQKKITEKADQKFHTIIAQASQNSALASVVVWLWELRNNSQISTIFHQHARDEGIQPSLDDHHRILMALRQRDPITARNAMNAHLTNSIELLNRMLDKNGTTSSAEQAQAGLT